MNINIKDAITALISKYPRTYSQQLVKNKYQQLYKDLISATQFLDQNNDLKINITIGTRCWHIINNISSTDQLKRCSQCGKVLVKNHIIYDKLTEKIEFCNKECKNTYYRNKETDISGLTETSIKYWIVKDGLTYQEARVKVRQYKPNFIDFWIRLGYSKSDAVWKRHNFLNKARYEYWIYRGYSEEDAKIQVAQEIYRRNSKHKKRKEYWLELGYADEDAKKLAKDEFARMNPACYNYWLSKGYSEDAARLEVRRRINTTKEYWIDRGQNEETAEQSAHMTALSSCIASEEYWICRGHSEEESIKLASKHGVHFEAAHAKFTKKQNRFCAEYWIARGYTTKEAKELARKANYETTKNISFEKRSHAAKQRAANRSVEEKLETRAKMSKILKAKCKTHSPIFKEYWIAKGYSLENAKQKVIETRYINSGSLSRASKIELQFFTELQEKLKIKINLQKWVTIEEKIYCQDGRYENIVFEFNGTNFHMDPRKYNVHDNNPKGITYAEVKRKDNEKYDAYRKKKYLTIEIWEKDYRENRDKLFQWINEIFVNYNLVKDQLFMTSLNMSIPVKSDSVKDLLYGNEVSERNTGGFGSSGTK